MSPSRRPFAGRMDAIGFVVDPAHVGLEEAHRRVLRAWVGGTRLYRLGGRLLLLLPGETSVRAEQSPGLPVVRSDDGFEVVADGERRTIREEDLAAYDVGELIDLGDLAVGVLAPAPVANVPPVDRTPPEATGRPDVRALARIGNADEATAKRRDRLARSLARISAGATDADHPPRGKGRIAAMLFRSPAGPAIGRRHQRYLDDLTTAFRHGRWDEALRSAIAVGGAGSGRLTTRLPGRRSAVTGPGARRTGAGSSVPLGSAAGEHLRDLYLAAAARLVTEGQYLRAAFVHADLLDDPVAAVELLEQHGEVRRAAEMAEGWDLDAALVVRLWWRAGQHDRAARIGAVRGAFADAVLRYERIDPAAAVDLRRAWVHERRAAGDHVGAVLVAWPVRDLRDEVLPDLGAGISNGGRTAGTMLAHLLEHVPGGDAASAARALFEDSQCVSARTAFVQALGERTLNDPALDRELVSRALVAMTTGDVELSGPAGRTLTGRLSRRADPLLLADLPRAQTPSGDPRHVLEVEARAAGPLRTYDVVAVGDGSVLVALGELGVRLLRPDGRVRARWEVPTHRIVVADHGQRVLLVANRGARHVVHRLDLPLGRPVPLPALDTVPFDSYDGTRPMLVSERGLEWVEQDGERWRLVWRELTEPGTHLQALARMPDGLTALFQHGPALHAWRWSLPGLTLRQRGTFEPGSALLVVASGQVGRLEQGSGVASLHWHATSGHRQTSETFYPHGEVSVLVSGPSYTLLEPTATEMRAVIHAGYGAAPCAIVRLPLGSTPRVRWTPGRIAVHDGNGWVLVIDTDRGALVADLAVDH